LVDKGICLIKLSEVEDMPQRLQVSVMSMYFYDDTDDWPEYRIIKDDIHRLEVAHIEFRKELQEAESACISDSENENLRAKVDELKKKLEEIEKRLNESLSMYR
jgi:predicted RNase H-like nuclease (RuvC/YqgF family)